MVFHCQATVLLTSLVNSKCIFRAADVFAFPLNAFITSGSDQRTVSDPVNHIDLTLDDSVDLNNQLIDLVAAITDDSDLYQLQDGNVTTAARTRRNSIPRNRSRGRFRRSRSRR